MSDTSVSAYPVCEMITQDVIETLGRISTSSGYHVNLTVERRKRRPNTPKHLLGVVNEGDDQEAGDDETDLGSKAWVRPYAVQVYILTSELASEEDYYQILNMARADIHKALMDDVTRGGWATNTEIRDPQEFDDPNDASGVIVFFDVTYRHKEGDPYKRVQDGAP